MSAARRYASARRCSSGYQVQDRRIGARAVGDRRRDVGRDRVEERQGHLHDLARHTVGMPQFLDVGLVAVRQMRQHIVPARITDRAGRLRDVAEHGQRAVPGAARDHSQLHGRQVLRLVDDHMAIGARRCAEQRARLVEQRDVAVRPAAATPYEQLLFRLGQDPLSGCRERRPRAGQRPNEPVRRHDGPRNLQHTVEIAVRAQRLLDLLEVADRTCPEHAAVLLVEPTQDAHPEALPRSEGDAELGARCREQLADLGRAHRDERPLEPQHELLGSRFEPELGCAGDHLDQAQVGLQPRDLGRVAALRLRAVHELADGPLLDGILPERRQDV